MILKTINEETMFSLGEKDVVYHLNTCKIKEKKMTYLFSLNVRE